MSSRESALSSTDALQEQGFGTAVLGDAAEALGRAATPDGGGPPGGAVAIPINFKELVVLTRRGVLVCYVDIVAVYLLWLRFISCWS